MTRSKNIDAAKSLMAALVRMPPKPHEDMKIKDKPAKAVRFSRRAAAKPKTA
jgi:hypothetical protein